MDQTPGNKTDYGTSPDSQSDPRFDAGQPYAGQNSAPQQGQPYGQYDASQQNRPYTSPYSTPGQGQPYTGPYTAPGQGQPYTSPYNAPGQGQPYTNPYTAPGQGQSYAGQHSAPQQNQSYGGPYDPLNDPSAIYNSRQDLSAPYGGAPQYHYGRPFNIMDSRYFAEQQARALRRHTQKREIVRLASAIGLAMLGAELVSLFIQIFLQETNLVSFYSSNFLFQTAMGMFYSLLAVGLPFFLARKYLVHRKFAVDIHLSAPKDPAKVILLLLIGLAGALGANFIVGLMTQGLNGFGIYLKSYRDIDPKNLTEVLLMFMGVAIIPPLIEEYAMRGVVFQSLRRYGNGFAIFTTSLIFGIFHGNPEQMVFAFICGLFFAYAAAATGSLWTSIILHAAVNSLSCLAVTLKLYSSEAIANRVMLIAEIAFFAIGIAAAVLYLNKYKDQRLFCYHGLQDLTGGEKLSKFIFNPIMVITFLIFIVEILSYFTTSAGAVQ